VFLAHSRVKHSCVPLGPVSTGAMNILGSAGEVFSLMLMILPDRKDFVWFMFQWHFKLVRVASTLFAHSAQERSLFTEEQYVCVYTYMIVV